MSEQQVRLVIVNESNDLVDIPTDVQFRYTIAPQRLAPTREYTVIAPATPTPTPTTPPTPTPTPTPLRDWPLPPVKNLPMSLTQLLTFEPGQIEIEPRTSFLIDAGRHDLEHIGNLSTLLLNEDLAQRDITFVLRITDDDNG